MHINRRLLNWGVFFILLGAVPLAVNQGLMPADTVSRAWTLWPILLIAAGIGLLLRRTQFEFLGGLLTAATLGLIGGALVAGGFVPFGGCSSDRGAVAFPPQRGELGSSASVNLNLGCGDLTVRTADGSGWTVEGADDDGQGPKIDASTDRLTVESDSRGGLNFLGSPDRWTVTLPTAPQIDLEAHVNAGAGRFDLRAAKLSGVDVQVNAGTLRLDLSQVASIGGLAVQLNAAADSRILLPNLSLKGKIEANAAAGIRICPPAGAGLRLTTHDNITANYNYADRGLVKVGGAWETPGFATAAVKIELETAANAAGFELEQEGSCGG